MANLPPALLARLQRRGIIPKGDQSNETVYKEPEEEVIAEDYDELSTVKGSGNGKDMAPGCPNKYNIYHDCTDHCFKQFGPGEVEPSTNIRLRYKRLLKKYPLPVNWQQVWEPGLSRYYFWNTVSDEVSWWPPDHPEARISLPVPKLKAQLKEEEQVLKSMDYDDEEEGGSSEEDSDGSGSDDSSYDSLDSEDESRKKQKTSHNRSFSPPHSSNRYLGNRSKNPKNDLDPMDPASYSDSCPRGKWSSGLEPNAKTGADSSATGSLYQARPYPNPGSVLRMNKS